MAWDDDTIDDPAAGPADPEPETDPVAALMEDTDELLAQGGERLAARLEQILRDPTDLARRVERAHRVLRNQRNLLEAVVVMAVLGMVMALSAALLVGTLATQQADASLTQSLLAQTALADQFRRDVAEAEAAVSRGRLSQRPFVIFVQVAP